MKNKTFRVKEIATGEISQWSMEEILEEINRDHGEGWIPYDETNWFYGWSEWVEHEGYYSIIEGEQQC